MAKPRPTSVAELRAVMDLGRIYEATLVTDDGAHLHGICDIDAKMVVIDPKVPIVETLIHELIHRARPRWGEKRVRKEEKRIMALLSPQDVQTWHRRYRRQARKRRPVDALEYE